MALNPDRVGTSYEPYLYEVSREKIREYALALGESDPRYLSDGDDCVAPPTFAATITLSRGSAAALADPDLGMHPKLVHGSQGYTYGQRPLRPGDVLRCTPRIADISVRGANEFLTIEVDCRFDDSDELAVRSETTLVLLGSAPDPSSESSANAPRSSDDEVRA